MKLLVKMPTRERAEQALEVLDRLILYSKDKKQNSYLFTLDEDDPQLEQFLAGLQMLITFGYDIKYHIGKSENKIHAVNRDLDIYTDWDVLVLMSDDMMPVTAGWDSIIKSIFSKIPDYDGVLYTPDGYTPLNTLPILGKKYYERFGYIYNPIYKSFFCDNEFHIIATVLKKHYIHNTVLFRHEHFCNNPAIANDSLYKKNQAQWDEDQEVFQKRKMEGFGYDIFNLDSYNK